jgi:hypothetical protein
MREVDRQNPPLRPDACHPDAAGFDEQHIGGGIALLGEQGRPQARVAATDHGELALVVSLERRVGLGCLGAVEPEGPSRASRRLS